MKKILKKTVIYQQGLTSKFSSDLSHTVVALSKGVLQNMRGVFGNLFGTQVKVEEDTQIKEDNKEKTCKKGKQAAVITITINTEPSESDLSAKVDELLEEIKKVNSNFASLKERTDLMALDLTALEVAVSEAKTVHGSAMLLLKSLHEELLASKGDPEKVAALAADLKASTEALASAVTSSHDVKEPHEVILHADDPETPTVEVTLPEIVPEVVEVHIEQVVETVDAASEEPQFEIEVVEASPEVVEVVTEAEAEHVADHDHNIALPEGEVATAVIETPEGEADIIVTVDPAVVEEAKEHGIDIFEVIEEAFNQAEEVHAEPVEETN